jgi:thymidylate kinase
MSFFIIEGANGSGKTTLLKNLERLGYETLSSPNGTPLAKMLRPACRGTEPWEDIDKNIQFMLFSASRYDEYVRLIHENSKTIIADRWWTSTYIYQCLLQGIDVGFMESTLHPEEKINLVILLDGDDNILINRVLEEREKNPSHGLCTWTKQEETMRNLIRLYRSSLPAYLRLKNIPCEIINTTNKTTQEVQDIAEMLIVKYGG